MELNKYVEQLGGKDALIKLIEDFFTDAIVGNCPPGEDRGLYRLSIHSGDLYESGKAADGQVYRRKLKSLFAYITRGMGAIEKAKFTLLGLASAINTLPEMLSKQNGGAAIYFTAKKEGEGYALVCYKSRKGMEQTSLEALFFPIDVPTDEEIKKTLFDLS